ncbi:radical SAM protein [Alphaproteobacteria bacterium]|nr:radical SAM protein [Alphaproteobacteria bacterium]
MKSYIKNCLNKSKIGARLVQFYQISRLLEVTFTKSDQLKLPTSVQLPITNRCNSRCEMCDVWQMDTSGEMDINEFKQVLTDPIFSQVKSVGINGGEPTLVLNISQYAQALCKLPRLRYLSIITHGFNTERALRSIAQIKKVCEEADVKFHVSVSLDGVGEVHNKVRNVPDVFEKTLATILAIKRDISSYCDTFDVACTVVKSNIHELPDLEAFSDLHDLPIKYRLGISNKRIGSDKLIDQFSVVSDQQYKMSAVEFFHWQTIKASSLTEKFKYYAIFDWLQSTQPSRLLGCVWKDQGITLGPRGDLYYCAVASDCLGSLREASGIELYADPKNLRHRKDIVSNSCDQCIHDYGGPITILSYLKFIKFLVKNRFSLKLYKFKSMFR